ncbi:pyridine nucleotide-disulphide oxidoreductase domain-containing protein, putative [Eimeria acervulina]|uniref:Pyridine nucleotide-disulphide oxidoreductase domain-containing protein, putative n=1 Tax=Eimeria acervulina TaxID=5801 RepID=U6GKM6_EIMAC|nr:pyridine nucleotide-disulphide oxidoreductase domain-containing protein, putative [Eimeria acervulina]CDI79843.1 pyridine nucleotide-disulphide oxidoreductase domain-containing protein, putative [Eimeria acervulina]
MKLLSLRLQRRIGSHALLQNGGVLLRQLQLQQQQQTQLQQQLQQQQQQQRQPFFRHAVDARAEGWGGCVTFQHQQQQLLLRQQQQQQKQQQHRKGGSAAMASAAAALCFAATGKRREVKLGDVGDFPEGGVYEVSVNEGVHTAEHLTCPWHDAKFDLKTGKCIGGPVTQGIRTYPVEVKGSGLFASLPERLEDEGPSPVCCSHRPDTVSSDSSSSSSSSSSIKSTSQPAPAAGRGAWMCAAAGIS